MNTSYSTIQKILLVGLIITAIVTVGTTILDHSFRSIPYTLSTFILIVGLHDIFIGLEQISKNQEQDVVWHKQPSILLGLALLFGAFIIFAQFGVATKFSDKIQSIILIATWILFGVPCLVFLFRWIMYTIKNKPKYLR